MTQAPLNALRAFEAVARCGSFGRAADELFVTQSAVSHQVRHLEQWLGAPLFDRPGGRPRLRPHGVELARSLGLALGDIEAACQRARRSGGPPSLTVAVIPSVAICWLIPRLAEFRARAPEVDLRILYAMHGKALDFGDVDAAVIFADTAPRVPDATAVRFLPGASAPVCSRAFAEVHRPLARPDELARAGLLHDTDRSAWQAWFAAAGDQAGSDAGPVFEDFNLLRAAALAGQGIALCPIAIIRDDLAAGRLVQISERTVRDEFAYYLMWRRAQDAARGMRSAFCDWLLATAA
jgi:DNA-binding transcriptional LysR family regulator